MPHAKRFHDEIEFADYLQLASLGLIEALDRFDPAVGMQFRTFAARRMHGALLDGIERFTEKQQQIAVRQRLEKQRRAAIKEATMGDADTSAGNGSHVLQYVAEAGLAFALAWILDGTGMIDDGEKTEIVPFYRSTELRELRQRIVDLVNAMAAQERSVLQRHYFQELPFQELADMLGVSRGRISQIHRKALGRLKEKLRGKRDCDVAW